MSHRGVNLALLLLGTTLLGAQRPAPMPRAASHRASFERAPEQANKRCESCHPSIAKEWRSSLHAAAHRDPLYQEALILEPLSFCESCHAPEADPKRAVSAQASHVGVACITCHRVDGDGDAVLAAPKATARAAKNAPHRIVRDARFASAEACSGCHQFSFEDGRPWKELMQSTANEHVHSSYAKTSCATCHMPLAGKDSHRSHAIDVSPAMIKGALAVKARRHGKRGVRVTLTPGRIGHAMPTGDLFRRLAVEARIVGAPKATVKREYLARHFKTVLRDQRPYRTMTVDDRPGGAKSHTITVDLDLGPPAVGHAVDWVVRYEKVSHPRSERERDAVVSAGVLLAAGRVTP